MTSPARLDSAGVKAAAAKAKVDWPRLQRDLKNRGAEIDALLTRTDSIAQAIGFNGTPALIVGSQVVGLGTATASNAATSATLASGGDVSGQFFGSAAQALAGVATFAGSRQYDTAFGGSQ